VELRSKYPTSADFDRRKPEADGKRRQSHSIRNWMTSEARPRWLVAIKSFVLMIVSRKHQTYYGVQFLLATEGRSFERSLAGFRATAAGARLLQTRPRSWDLLNDKRTLESCPADSLGRWYANFMLGHGLNEDLSQGMAIENGGRLEHDPARAWFRTRVEAGHDMRHVLAGYGPDVLGEICLLSFRFGQTRHAGMLALVVLGYLNLMFTCRRPVFGALVEAYWRGRGAQLLDWLPWEEGFAEPLAAQRAALGVTPPKRYSNPFAPEAYVGL